MNNYILISRTFSEVTPESAEIGDFSDNGFIDECIEVTFSELVDLMKKHTEPSQSPNDGNTCVWYTTPSFITDYRTGTTREESIHFHIDNTSNGNKYWKIAAKIAKLVNH